ncbi:MAG: 50S ribosomal protein L6 [Pseudomonadota bacterium]|jgi:large subunit ribosomal protein L6
MSRVAKKPVAIPSGVEVKVSGQNIEAKGPKGSAQFSVNELITLVQEDGELRVEAKSTKDIPMAGTMRALVNNLITGVSEGFEKKLELVGVGYRAQAQGNQLNLTLGFSHPVEYQVPEGITVQTPSQTEVVVSGVDKALVGQVAAELRAYRPPEPYKGKGVRYANERIIRKEAKKK